MDSEQVDFVRLLAEHSSSIYGFVLALVPNRADADDVYQCTCVVLWEKFSTFQPGTNFRSWACRIAQLQILSQRRKQQRIRLLSDAAVNALASEAEALAVQGTSREEALAECLEKLSPTDRKLIEQKYFGKFSVAAMAQRNNCSTDAVYRALSRVHSVLLRCVQRSLGEPLSAWSSD